ncbi:BirA family biotin operon repressor/biotin-[acetyl-CoA-carboxylase] ligase [Mobilisporobacter senegalensis]|uniref:Bifunctional ligase/repressor BirA n=1 Tax=Mobilisporobacter senegalensis TaxID=1329262 RepID=A0A3N1XQM6_9FIRM|nr:biotin--[acetyl-CoA-carboxylase] ligase [Mobilisporobacter senegalensis]ROR28578.1 BirA family biotin operon repressor/biotin-[acetyl-CoA-carboxylase] ligase [Mobilisporobacter senegalensis]
MKKEILKILKNNKEYVSGQELCKGLGVSRTAVWKVMNQLKEEGYEIESVSKKGYKLLDKPDILSREEIESQMDTEVFGKKVVYFDEIDSTNIYAKKLGEEMDSHGILVVADRQIQGKGRRGRDWDSPKGSGVWMTLVLKPGIKPADASMITLVAGLSVCKAIQKLYGANCLIKWPNDIVINGKKICGILTEMSTEFDYINHLVVGIGININTMEFPEELKLTATSIEKECGSRVLRSELIAAIMKEFELNYNIFMETCDLEGLMKDYNKYLVSINKEVVIIEAGQKYEAIALGINKNGELRIRTKDGEEKNVFSGEVSVRGIYGYI